MRGFLPCAAVLVLCFTPRAAADPYPIDQTPHDAVFMASHVVIVSSTDGSTFQVERTYRGNRAVGSKVEIAGVELIAMGEQEEGHDGPGVLDVPITEETRILVYLVPDPKNPAGLSMYGGQATFQFRDVEKIDELDALAKETMALHRKWREARDQRNPQFRIQQLIPFLFSPYSGESCLRLTYDELTKLNPASGDFIATQLETAPSGETPRLLGAISALPTPKGHAAAIAAVDQAVTRFRSYLADRDIKALDVSNDSHETAQEVRQNDRIIYTGLCAISSFRDPNDLPYIRGLVPYLLANHFRDPTEVCVRAMRVSPAPENVPVLISIWEDHKSRGVPRTQTSLLHGLAWAMEAQHDSAVIPALAEMLDNPDCHDSIRQVLGQVAKRIFRTDAEFRQWYASQPHPAAKTEAQAP